MVGVAQSEGVDDGGWNTKESRDQASVGSARLVFHGFFMVFHGFSWFQVGFSWFSWFFMVPGWFFMVFHGFSWFFIVFLVHFCKYHLFQVTSKVRVEVPGLKMIC